MFKKTRLRIFALIMAVATLIITLMLSIIYIANRHYSYERGISLLESYMENNIGPRPDFGPVPVPPNVRPGMRDDHNKMFRLSTFYSVLYNADGEAVMISSGDGDLYSDEEILEIADEILAGGKNRGTFNKMPYMVRTGAEGTVVALIDQTMEADNSGRLFEYSLAVGFAAWAIIGVLAWFFSGRIVSPLEKNDNRQRQFISDAGHELKTPISVISANADLLAMELGENKWLSNIRYENERMGTLVKQLLELVRAENMQQTGEDLDFSRLVSGGALPFESVAFESGLELKTEIEEGIHVNGDRNRLGQLVSILVDNAIDHGTDGKEILVKLYSSKRNAVLCVVNSGEPIPEEVRERLFERFYRADEARGDDSGHYGLGLAIAKAVVTAHGGRIEVDCHDGLIEFRAMIPRG